jgi:hypothetical protein
MAATFIWDRAAQDTLYRYGEGQYDIHVTPVQREEISQLAECLATHDSSPTVKLRYIYAAIKQWREENYGGAERIAFYVRNHGI